MHHLPRGGGDGEHGAQDGAGAEAREPVNGTQSEGRPRRLSSDLTHQTREGAEFEAAPEELHHPQQDDDEAGDQYEGAPLPIN